jgi:hypothetical protein
MSERTFVLASSPASTSSGEDKQKDRTRGADSPEGSIKCLECGATVAWAGEPPDDCLRCGVELQR